VHAEYRTAGAQRLILLTEWRAEALPNQIDQRVAAAQIQRHFGIIIEEAGDAISTSGLRENRHRAVAGLFRFI
jgi:hypothetical protein